MSITRAWWPDAALIHNTRSNELCHVRPHVPYRDRFMCAVLCLLHYAYTQDYSEITYRLHKFSRIYNFEISKRTHCKCIHSVKPISTRKLLWKTPQHQYLEGSSHDLHFVACLMNFGEWARASSWFYTICNEDMGATKWHQGHPLIDRGKKIDWRYFREKYVVCDIVNFSIFELMPNCNVNQKVPKIGPFSSLPSHLSLHII